MHVSVVATVTQPERVVSRVTNTFTFVFAVDLAPSASGLAVRNVTQGSWFSGGVWDCYL